jgi:hypothetical protein
MRNRARLLIACISASLVVLAGAAFALVGHGAPARASQFKNGKISILDRPAKPEDSLPESVSALPGLAEDIRAANSTRLAYSREGLNVYVARASQDRICLVIVGGAPGELATFNCVESQILKRGALVLSSRNQDGTFDLFGVVDDDATSARADARRVSASDNVFVLPSVTASSVTISTSAGEKTMDLGTHAPR